MTPAWLPTCNYCIITHFNPLFNKTTYQYVGPLPRNKFVHIRTHTHTYIHTHTHTHTHRACQGFFHCIGSDWVYLDIHKRSATAVVADELCLLLIKTVYMC